MILDDNKLDYDSEKDLDIDLIDEVVTFAEQTERHYQGHYLVVNGDALCPVGIATPHDAAEKFANECGATGCIAGWGALFAGWCQLRWSFEGMDGQWIGQASESVGNPANGDVLSMHAAARYEMGLSVDQANHMFDGHNSLEHIREMVEALRADPNANLFRLMTTYRED